VITPLQMLATLELHAQPHAQGQHLMH